MKPIIHNANLWCQILPIERLYTCVLSPFQVGGLDCVIVIDCEEGYARENAGSRAGQIETYKQDTLPVLGHYDDLRRLEYVSIVDTKYQFTSNKLVS